MSRRTTQLPPVVYPSLIGRALCTYYRAPDHPAKLRLLNAIEELLGRRRIIVPASFGFLLAVDQADLIQRAVLYDGVWERAETEWLSRQLRPTDVFYDVGANIGYFTCLALRAGVSHVVAFEPDPLTADVLTLNLRLNGFDAARCTIARVGLSDEPGVLQFHRSDVLNTGQSGFAATRSVDSFSVPVDSLDHFVASRAQPAPTVLKVDVEGWEEPMFRGAQGLLRERPPRLILFEADCDGQGAMSAGTLRELLETASYEITRLDFGPGDGKANFVAAHRS